MTKSKPSFKITSTASQSKKRSKKLGLISRKFFGSLKIERIPSVREKILSNLLPSQLSQTRVTKSESPKPINTETEIDKPIWEIISDIGEQIPDEIWAKAPTDGSINYRHYLYGVPKRKE